MRIKKHCAHMSRGGIKLAASLIALTVGYSTSYGHSRTHSGDSKGQDQYTVVSTQAGKVRGIVKGSVAQFLGIPYAKPPIGQLRWANPVPPDRWNGVRDATQYGKFCAQLKTLGDFSAASEDEDCLYLNVFAPKNGNGKRRPVMIWIHGGGSVGQSNGTDGSALVKEQDVVVVTLNFRIGALGSLVHPAFDKGGAATLYTLRDQQFAMKWVRDNIDNFGGDRNNVTLFGESIGGVDIQMHLISPTAKGLFQRVIFESGPSRYFTPLSSLAAAEEQGKAYATKVGCPDQSADCLRKVPVATLLAAGSGAPTVPIQDGHVILSSVSDAIRSGKFNRVPIMDVTNHDEYRWFVAFTEVSTGHVVTSAEYPDKLNASFGANGPAVLNAYPLTAYDSPSGALAAAQGDNNYPCQVRSFDVDASRHVPVYGLEFNDPNSPGILPPVSFKLLAAHTHEIQYIFPGWRGVYQGVVPPFTPKQERLAKDMRAIWATFARRGQLPGFPRIYDNRYSIVSLEPANIHVTRNFFQDHKCGFWNTIRNWTPVSPPIR